MINKDILYTAYNYNTQHHDKNSRSIIQPRSTIADEIVNEQKRANELLRLSYRHKSFYTS